MRTMRYSNYTLAVLIVGAAAGGCRETDRSSSRPDVMGAYQALVSAVAACGEGLAACAAEAAGDAAALQSCRDAFAACRQSAGGPAAGALADAIRACTESARECSSEASDDDARSACREELQACLGTNRPEPQNGDAGVDHPDAPVAACIDTLRACVAQDGSAEACAREVRACVVAAVPAPDGVIPDDPGSAANDAGQPDDLPEPPVTPGEPPAPDAGMAGDPPSPSCMDAFQACLSAGGSQQSCGQAQRDCAGRGMP